MKKYALAMIAMLVASNASAEIQIGQPAQNFSAGTAAGKSVQLSDYKGKVVVLEWTNPGCPFVKKFYGLGKMQSWQKAAKDKGVVWLSINSSAVGKEGNLDAAAATKLIAEQKIMSTEYLLDPEGTVGKLYGAKTTPHMFVIDSKGVVVYAGAIDDKATTNPADIDGAKNYVTAALDATLAGKPVATPSTQSYGCNVKY